MNQMAKSATESLTKYCDPVVPHKGEYNHGDQVKRRTHDKVWDNYEKTSTVGSKKYVYCTKKFFAGEVLSQTATHFKVRSVATNRVRTIKKSSAVPCMTPKEYYRDKQTGEWCFCVSVSGTHSNVVPVYSERLTSSEEDSAKQTETSADDSDSEFDPFETNAKKGKKNANTKTTNKRKGTELVATRRSKRRATRKNSAAAASQPAQQPAASSEDQQPATSSADQQPAASSADQQPAASQPAQQPAASSEDQQPATSSADQQPAASSADQQPAASQPAQQPAASSADQQPAASQPAQQPAASSEDQQPATSSADQQPVASSADQQPAASSAVQQPVASSADQQPAASSADQQPAASSADQQPAASSANQQQESARITAPCHNGNPDDQTAVVQSHDQRIPANKLEARHVVHEPEKYCPTHLFPHQRICFIPKQICFHTDAFVFILKQICFHTNAFVLF